MNIKEWYSICEAAERLSISPAAVRRLIKNGTIIARNFEKRLWRIHEDEIKKMKEPKNVMVEDRNNNP